MRTTIFNLFISINLAVLYLTLCKCTDTQIQKNMRPMKVNETAISLKPDEKGTTGSDSIYLEIRDSDSIIIYWDAPAWCPDTVQYYELLYQDSHDTVWNLIKENIPPFPNPEVIIRRNEIPSLDSFFIFGVRYFSKDGIISKLHQSIDSTANPPGGWSLFWKP